MLKQNISRQSRIYEFFKFAKKRIQDAQLPQVASSLTLTTILSIVPALAVILAAFSAFPMFEPYRENFEQLVLRSMLPTEYSEQIIGYIKNFASQATNLTVFGLIGLGVTAIMCIYNIDMALNNTFQVVKVRGMIQRFLIYWAFLTIGPIIVVLSLAGSTYVTSMAFMGKITALTQWSVPALQFFVQGLLLAAIYFYVPNCRVLWKDALISGLFISLILTIFRWVFGIYVLRGSYGTIYGAFAVIPILLTWTYVMWMLVLAGAALTATMPMVRAKRYQDFAKIGNGFLSAIAVLEILFRAKRDKQPPMSDVDLARSIGSYPEEISQLLSRLEPRHYVIGIQNGNGQNWVLLADAGKTTFRGVFEEFCIDPSNSILQKGLSENEWLTEGLNTAWLNQTMEDVFGKKDWKTNFKNNSGDSLSQPS